MPHIISSSPFLSLKQDASCGRNDAAPAVNGVANRIPHGDSPAPVSSLSSKSTSYTNSLSNGAAHALTNGDFEAAQKAAGNHEFLKLSQPQQDVLLLHGPGKRYSLERAQQIPELQNDREILVQVLAIGLNPVDWKGPDYGGFGDDLSELSILIHSVGFGQPQYPWINGRDFAGIVVRGSKSASRINVGDVVFGPSTDYRDVRKAAYQEYVVTTDYNVARVTPEAGVKGGAAVGVAFAAASIALGVSFGLDFGFLKNTPSGPDLYSLVRDYQHEIPVDVRDECTANIASNDRAQRGDWLAIWGGMWTMTAEGYDFY